MILTETQQKMYDRLKSGKPVSRDELRKCLWDELAKSSTTVKFHISNLRSIIRQHGMDIVCRSIDGVPHYYIVNHVTSEPTNAAAN